MSEECTSVLTQHSLSLSLFLFGVSQSVSLCPERADSCSSASQLKASAAAVGTLPSRSSLPKFLGAVAPPPLCAINWRGEKARAHLLRPLPRNATTQREYSFRCSRVSALSSIPIQGREDTVCTRMQCCCAQISTSLLSLFFFHLPELCFQLVAVSIDSPLLADELLSKWTLNWTFLQVGWLLYNGFNRFSKKQQQQNYLYR